MDERGSMHFVNDFHFDDVKRFYFIKHPDTRIVRAWQGHQFEKKYFFTITGIFVVAWVKIDNFTNPSFNLIPEYHILSHQNCEVLFIPKGYANGLKALEPDSEIMIFSNLSLEESIKEGIKYPSELWLDWSKF